MPHVCLKVLRHSTVSMFQMRTVMSSLPDARCLLSELQSRQITPALPSQHVSYGVTDTDRPWATVDRRLDLASACYVHNGNIYLPFSCPSHARPPCMHAAAGTRMQAHDTTSAARSMQMTCLPMSDEVSHVFPLRGPSFHDAMHIAADEEGAVGTPRR